MRQQIVYFLLLPDTLLIDLAGPADALLFANRYQDDIRFELKFISPANSVSCSLGLQLSPLLALPDTLEDNAIIVIPGMTGACSNYQSPQELACIRWLREHVKASHRVACICSGALLAAHAGLLHGHAATTHHDHCADLATIDSSIRVEENRIFVEHGMMITSAGVTAGIDLALHLIAKLVNPMVATTVARNMVVYMRRCGTDAQLSAWLKHRQHLHPAVHKVQDAIMKHPEYDWSLPELADLACTSTRHLSRLFKTHAGLTAQEYLSGLRLELAAKLLTQTTWSVEKVAQAAGFGSARQFRRIWTRSYGLAPAAYQLQHPRNPLST